MLILFFLSFAFCFAFVVALFCFHFIFNFISLSECPVERRTRTLEQMFYLLLSFLPRWQKTGVKPRRALLPLDQFASIVSELARLPSDETK